MANKYTSAQRENTEKLQYCLISKIADEWSQKWAADHGSVFNGVDDLPSKNLFFEELRIDITCCIEEQRGRVSKEDYISKDTLLRFLDKDYDYGFSKKTLDIISVYCGYDSWQSFMAEIAAETPVVPTINLYTLVTTQRAIRQIENSQIRIELPQRNPIHYRWMAVVVALALLIVAGYWYRYIYYPNRQLSTEEIDNLTFEVINKTSDYNPSNVTFKYDFSRLGIDSLKVVFPLNHGLREHSHETLTRPSDTFSFDFYKPGLAHVYLYHKNQLLKKLHIYTKSHGWACWYTIPGWINTNFPYKDFYTGGMLFLHPEKIINTAHRNNYYAEIRHAKDFGISLDSLTLTYNIKFSPEEYAISCYETGVKLGFESGQRFDIDWGREGCISTHDTVRYDSKYDGYSLHFWHIFYEWSKVKVMFKGGRVKVWINDHLLTDTQQKAPNAALSSIGLFSKGSAMYDNVHISNSYTGQTVFFDDFNTVPARSEKGY